jgi:hypothetical protein
MWWFSLDRVGPVVDSIERHNENFVSTDGEGIFLKAGWLSLFQKEFEITGTNFDFEITGTNFD